MTMDAQTAEHIFRSLSRRPSVLFLGQSYLGMAREKDPFLESIRQRFSLGDKEGISPLTALVEKLESEDASSSLRWLHRRSETVPISESLDLISDIPWSNVYTSALDEVWVRAFKKPWRSLHAVFAEYAWPLETRDRNRMCSTFLFGCVDKEDEDSQIPTNPFRLDERSQIAVTLLRRLPDTITALGVLLIEGYNPVLDWLKPKELYPVLNALGKGQTLFFSRDASHKGDRYLSRLRDSGKLVFINEDLASFLRKGVEQGSVSLGDPAAKLPTGRQITIDSKPHHIPKDLWLNLTGVALILDDNTFTPAQPLPPDLEYIQYRAFLADPVKSNDWSPYARGFVFERDFAHVLRNDCEKKLKQTRLQTSPILLHGESGTGKTVALAHLAYIVGSLGEFPVLFIERSISSVDWRPIDRYLNWAEDCGAPSSLVVWDGMRDGSVYIELLNKLADRGRKVVVVGSCYPTSKPRGKAAFAEIRASRELNIVERGRFTDYLKRFDNGFADRLRAGNLQIDSTFLVALYRLLPPTRPRLTKGFAQEVEHAQKDILEQNQIASGQDQGLNSLELAFEQIGWPKERLFKEAAGEVAGETLTELDELFALVMVPGKYGFEVPIELILGALGKTVNSIMLQAFQTTVLMWSEKPSGEILVGPRHSLEAKLYVDHFFGGAAEAEAHFIQKLLHGLKRGRAGSQHVDFIVELLRLLGPNSPVDRNKTQFRRCILSFAQSLTSLRKDKSVLNARLMLQEGSFYREAVRADDQQLSVKQKEHYLNISEEVLLQACARDDCSPGLKSAINSELAACYGTMIHLLETETPGNSAILQLYMRARDSLGEAARIDSGTAHGVVTLGWISREMLRSSLLTEQDRSEIEAELMFRFDEAVPASMDKIQQEYFFRERHKIMEQLGNTALAEQTFELLRKAGSKAGYYLRARGMFGEFPEAQALAKDKIGLSEAEAYLRKYWKEINNDQRCVGLYLKVWWFTNVGTPIFYKERQVLPIDEKQWATLYDVLERLKEIKEQDCPAWLRFLHALCLFHLGSIMPSRAEFQEIASDSDLNVAGNRLRKYFVASKSGKPWVFDGVVRNSVKNTDFGQVWVNELRNAVPVIPRDFDVQELRQGQTLTDFHIAFGYTGPIAQPPHFMRSRR